MFHKIVYYYLRYVYYSIIYTCILYTQQFTCFCRYNNRRILNYYYILLYFSCFATCLRIAVNDFYSNFMSARQRVVILYVYIYFLILIRVSILYMGKYGYTLVCFKVDNIDRVITYYTRV